MAPLPQSSAGPWKATLTPGTGVEWEKLIAANEEDAPEPRSYHVSVVYDVRYPVIPLCHRVLGICWL